jgi:hypothetical protein
MKNKKALITITLFLISLFSFSQDLIIKRDSTKIFCKITKEDSLTIFYKSLRDKQANEQSILKTNIISYFNSTTIAKQAKNKIDTAERIWQAKKLNPGLYKSRIEYITNSPSITKKFLVFQRNEADLVFQHGGEYQYQLLKGEGSVDYSEIIGFCDGQDVYLNYDHPKGFSKIEYLGAYSYFTYVYHGMGALALVPDQLVVIDEEGNSNEASPHYIKKILAEKYPDLLTQYKQEESPREKRQEYLRELNNYLKSKTKK